MAKVQKKGLVRIFNAYKYSMKGFKAGLENEAAIRQEFVLAIILTIVACVFFNNDVVKLILLIAMPWLTVVAELLNSAVEAVVDRIGTEYHELSGRAKDLGSAAVFVMLILTLVTWILIVLTKFGILN
ncbi:MAG: diacylglycerol kinase [Succinatimonas sp.]|jgi:diacylglycerol kinase (ATP)|nr:diacylglycerol kinase [Succinatimonas sp.]MDD5868141.1 diacylglycerol kinase [Succinatimonas sp.]MDY5721727.1 diacylglycerol kinase [Succinivibrio sp.]